jgi:hypothetical protein
MPIREMLRRSAGTFGDGKAKEAYRRNCQKAKGGVEQGGSSMPHCLKAASHRTVWGELRETASRFESSRPRRGEYR